MYIEPIQTEYVYQVSDEEKLQMLNNHFNEVFSWFCNSHFETSARSMIVDGIHRHASGIPYPFLNMVLGNPKGDSIQKNLTHFHLLDLPFVWYVDVSSDPHYKRELIAHGFEDIGIFQGVIGPLNKMIPEPKIPEGCTIELVDTESAMDEFNALICETFEVNEASKILYRNVLWKLANTEPPKMFHWMARKEGVAVSAISTCVDGPIVSFWNGASAPQFRRQGFSTAIRRTALKDAVSRGCRFGASYLMPNSPAMGICTKLGYEPKWQFHGFLAPKNKDFSLSKND